MFGHLFPTFAYILIIFLVRFCFLQELNVGQKVVSLFSLLNQAKMLHIPINCESKLETRFPMRNQTLHFYTWLPNTCQIYEFLNHSPCFTIIYKRKNEYMCYSLEYIWKYIVAWGRVFFICWHLFLFLQFCIYTLSFLIFIVSLVFPLSRSFIFY